MTFSFIQNFNFKYLEKKTRQLGEKTKLKLESKKKTFLEIFILPLRNIEDLKNQLSVNKLPRNVIFVLIPNVKFNLILLITLNYLIVFIFFWFFRIIFFW